MTYTYYTTQRPAAPGAIPMQGLLDIKHYDTKKQLEYCAAYSQLTYSRELTTSEINDYELSDNTPIHKSIAIPEITEASVKMFTTFGTSDYEATEREYNRLEKRIASIYKKLLRMLAIGEIDIIHYTNGTIYTITRSPREGYVFQKSSFTTKYEAIRHQSFNDYDDMQAKNEVDYDVTLYYGVTA